MNFDKIKNVFKKKSFDIVESKMDLEGDMIYRIKAKNDIPEHGVKKGDIGGWVGSLENIKGSGWVAQEAVVKQNAVVKDGLVTNRAIVKGNTVIDGVGVEISHRAKLDGEIRVLNNVTVSDHAEVKGIATLKNNAKLFDYSKIDGHGVTISNDAVLKDEATILGKAKIYNDAIVGGEATITGRAEVFNNSHVTDKAYVAENSKVFDDAFVGGRAKVLDSARVYGKSRLFQNSSVQDSSRVGARTVLSGNSSIKGKVQISGGRISLNNGVLFQDVELNKEKVLTVANNLQSKAPEYNEFNYAIKGENAEINGKSAVKISNETFSNLVSNGKLIYDSEPDGGFSLSSINGGDKIKGVEQDKNVYITSVLTRDQKFDQNVDAFRQLNNKAIEGFMGVDPKLENKEGFAVTNLRGIAETLDESFSLKDTKAIYESQHVSTAFAVDRPFMNEVNIDAAKAVYVGSEVTANMDNGYFHSIVDKISNEYSFSAHKEDVRESLSDLANLFEHVKEYQGKSEVDVNFAIGEFNSMKQAFIERTLKGSLEGETKKAIQELVSDNEISVDKDLKVLGNWNSEKNAVEINSLADNNLIELKKGHDIIVKEPKVVLGENKIEFDKYKLTQIVAVKDIPEHGVKKGDLGGYVEDINSIQGNGWVAKEARVFKRGVVKGNAMLGGESSLYDGVMKGNAKVEGNVVLKHGSVVEGNAKITGHAHISGVVNGNARIDGGNDDLKAVNIGHNVTVTDEAKIGPGVVLNNSVVKGDSTIEGDIGIYRSNVANSEIKGEVTLFNNVNIENSKIEGKLHIGNEISVKNQSLKGEGEQVMSLSDLKAVVKQAPEENKSNDKDNDRSSGMKM